MEFDMLKAQWQAYDQKLTESLRLNRRLLRDKLVAKVDSALQRHERGLWLELGFDVVLLLLLGSFISDTWGEWRFVLPALVWHIFIIISMVVTIRELVTLREIDYNGPVATLQKRVEQVRLLHAWVNKWTWTLLPVLWVPILIIGMRWLLGLDAYAVLGTPTLLANLAFGLVLIPVIVVASRTLAGRGEQWPWVQSIIDDVNGEHVVAAARFLREVRDFEEER
ncbi:MAG: hypothetical protein MUD01_02700 [Chloroflexaceae bacterium]|jgi:hypothetical protein|nr:hypothetical protein [Chloroflexaceae bacterium]